jgi:hypothetical protein
MLASRWHLDLFFNPEDGNIKFLLNVGCLQTDYMALYPQRQKSS